MAFWIVSAFVIALFIFLIWLDVGVRRSIRRSLEGLATSKCPSCDATFGMESAIAARQRYLKSCKEMQKKKPGVRFRYSNEWSVTCPVCEVVSKFDATNNMLVAKK